MLRLILSSRLSSVATSAGSAPGGRCLLTRRKEMVWFFMGTYRKGVMKREADRRLL